jgi:antitoxin MazE
MMKSTLRQIGNSRGIIIPASVLAECEIQNEIELTVENGRLVITPVKPARSGWFDNYKPGTGEDAWTDLADTPKEQGDWEW